MMPRESNVTKINVETVKLRMIHYFLFQSCPGTRYMTQARTQIHFVTWQIKIDLFYYRCPARALCNESHCVFCNVILGQVTLKHDICVDPHSCQNLPFSFVLQKHKFEVNIYIVPSSALVTSSIVCLRNSMQT